MFAVLLNMDLQITLFGFAEEDKILPKYALDAAKDFGYTNYVGQNKLRLNDAGYRAFKRLQAIEES
jgi:hypothetical protein